MVAGASRGPPRRDGLSVRAMTRIDVMRPLLGVEEVAAVTAAITSGWVAQGPRVAEFEAQFAARMQVPHAVATSSCTSALHLALVVAGIGPGDDVVVPSFSFIATTNAVRYVGARPVFADVDELTGNLSADTVERALTSQTRAVIAVDQGGVPVNLEDLRRVCDPREILIVEDAACGVGSTYRGAPVGAGAVLACWSFHPRKLLTTGEGGMLTSSNEDWAGRARKLREHAMDIPASARHMSTLAPAESYSEPGFNYRMTDLQGAMGVVQLGRLDEIVRRRREIATYYRAGIADVAGLRLVDDPPWGTSNYQSCWVEVGEAYQTDRDGLLKALADVDISARRGIMAAHRQPAWIAEDTGSADLSVTERLTDNTLILPVHHGLTAEDLDRVLDVVREPAVVRTR